MRQKTCCFTGHRPGKLPFGYDEGHEDCIHLKLKLAAEIEEMRQKGVTTFITGMAQGVDIWCAEIVLDLKRAYPDEEIRLVAVIPYEGQAKRWRQTDQIRYRHILAAADEKVILHANYNNGCMLEGNRYMVNASTHLIAVFGGDKGGTKYTLNYARKKGLDIVVIDPNHIKDSHLVSLHAE